MLKKIFFAGCLLVTSMASQAGLISHYGYEREESSNIVKGGGLEWLKWDVTKGLSIRAALERYSAEDWRLASNTQMAALFDAFMFGTNKWHSNESDYQKATSAWNISESSQHNSFLKLFGSTGQVDNCNNVYTNYCYSQSDIYNETQAFFGADINGNSRFNRALVFDDARYIYDQYSFPVDAKVEIYSDRYLSHDSLPYVGVALVRVSSAPPQPVNAPVSFSLLALGLIALSFRRRQALRR